MEKIKQKLASAKVLNSLDLKLIAMALMLLDHIFNVFVYDLYTGYRYDTHALDWMTWLGRLAFPIFAFQIAEGYVHTRNFNKYWIRMILFAIVSEIPFDLAFYGRVYYPDHQNVMLTFALALPLLKIIDSSRQKGKAAFWVTSAVCIAVGYVAGCVISCDYMGLGAPTVIFFYIFRDLKLEKLWQVLSMAFIFIFAHGLNSVNWFALDFVGFDAASGIWNSLIAHQFYIHTFADFAWKISTEALAMFALILIWMYNGKQGKRSKAVQYACYAFYPAHLLILGLINMVVY